MLIDFREIQKRYDEFCQQTTEWFLWFCYGVIGICMYEMVSCILKGGHR